MMEPGKVAWYTLLRSLRTGAEAAGGLCPYCETGNDPKAKGCHYCEPVRRAYRTLDEALYPSPPPNENKGD